MIIVISVQLRYLFSLYATEETSHPDTGNPIILYLFIYSKKNLDKTQDKHKIEMNGKAGGGLCQMANIHGHGHGPGNLEKVSIGFIIHH